MARRKKYPKLPSGWGSIRYLGKGRRNPYAVHPPCTEVDDKGNYIRPPALCYVSDWYVGFAVLNSYRAGTYKPGDEILMADSMGAKEGGGAELESLAERILRDYGQWHGAQEKGPKEPTFAEVYQEFFDWKFGEHAAKKLSASRKKTVVAAFNHFKAIHDKVFRELRVEDLQAVINASELGQASLEHMKSLLTEMYKWAEPRELCDKDYARHVVIPSGAKEDEHGVPFTADDIRKLWADLENLDSEMMVVMCYSGFRISAYKDIEVNLEERYFKGGLKTQAGKDRIVPIHPAILPLVETRLSRDGKMLSISSDQFARRMHKRLEALGIDSSHTPHDCRHTFSSLCERYGVPEADRKRMMGHSFGGDITNGVYGHRTLEDLTKSICMIPDPVGL